MDNNINNKFVLKLDASQLEQYLICPLSWYYKYHENIRLAGQKRKAAPDKGTLIHKMLETFYEKLNTGVSRGEAAAFTQNKFISENWAKEYDLESETQFLKKRFFQYQAHYTDNDFSLLRDMQGKPAVEVGFAKVLYEDERAIYIVEGRIDGITEISGGAAAWVDHKTQGRASLLYQYCPQFLTYTWATGLEWGIVNYIRMHEEYDPKKTFYKQLINFPRHLIAAWEAKMKKIFWSIDKKLNSELLPKSNEFILQEFFAERNESSCAGPFKSNSCQFTTLCEVDLADARLYNIVKASQYQVVEKWSPWRIESEE